MPVPVAPANEQPLQADSTDAMAQANAVEPTWCDRTVQATSACRQFCRRSLAGLASKKTVTSTLSWFLRNWLSSAESMEIAAQEIGFM